MYILTYIYIYIYIYIRHPGEALTGVFSFLITVFYLLSMGRVNGIVSRSSGGAGIVFFSLQRVSHRN